MKRIKCNRCGSVFFGTDEAICEECRGIVKKVNDGDMCHNCGASPYVLNKENKGCERCGFFPKDKMLQCTECKKIIVSIKELFVPMIQVQEFRNLEARTFESPEILCMQCHNEEEKPETMEQKVDRLIDVLSEISINLGYICDRYNGHKN
jgi:ribosomal protein L37E